MKFPTDIASVRNNGHSAATFFTGFSWDEIEEITTALKRSYRDPNADGIDSPDYGGLPDTIAKRLSADQIERLREEQPRTVKAVARVLARGSS